MRSLLRNSLLCLLAAWIMTACDSRTVYHTYLPIPQKGWGKSDTLFFHVPVNDSLTLLHLTAGVRNESNYPYRNLYLFISHNLEDSAKWETDTLEVELTDKEGRWRGTGWGSLYQSTLPMKSIGIRRAGSYTIKVTHGMKDEVLKGISDIGIKIDK